MRESVDSRFYSVLAYPIKMRGELEGVIVIASFDEERHKIIVEKQRQLMVYLERISDLISSKLEQEILIEQTQIMNNQLNSVITGNGGTGFFVFTDGRDMPKQYVRPEIPPFQ